MPTTMNRAFDRLPGWAAMLALPVLLALLALAMGCADKKIEPDPFFAKWQTMAQESKGHSPSPRPHALEVTDIGPEKRAEPEAVQQNLPDTRVVLHLRDTEIAAVLRALGRLAQVDILLSPGVQGKANLDVRNAPWSQVFTGLLKSHGLTWAWEGQVLRVIGAEDLQREASVSNAMGGNLALRQTSVVAIRFADAARLRENLQPLMTTGPGGQPMGTIVVDEHNNALIIQAAPEEARRILRLVEQLDKPRAQILLKAHIVETTKDTARDLGMQWGGMYSSSMDGNNFFAIPGGTGGRPGTDGAWEYDSALGSGIGGQGFGVSLPADLTKGGTQLGLMFGKLGGNILELQLSALQENGRVNILSSPSITTLDNQMAFTENGERVPYVAIDEEGKLNVKFEDAVLRLEITPHVIDREQLKLKILVKKDEVDTTRNVLGNPFIIKKQTETVLVVEDGETVVISGLSRDRDTSRDQKVPWLGDIPLLGRLFQRKQDSALMEEVLIFITPQVLPFRAPVAQAGISAADKTQQAR